MYKTAFLIMAPDGDPNKYRASIKTAKMELIAIVVKMMDFDQAVDVCKNLVQNEGVQAFILCPGFHHEAVARIANAVGQGVAVNVARGDVAGTMTTGGILAAEGWFSDRG